MCPRHLTRTCATLAEAVQPRWTHATGVDASFGRPHFIALRWVRPSKGPVGSFWPAHRLNEPSTPDSALRGHDRVSVDLPSAAHAPLQRWAPHRPRTPHEGRGAAPSGARVKEPQPRARSLPFREGSGSRSRPPRLFEGPLFRLPEKSTSAPPGPCMPSKAV